MVTYHHFSSYRAAVVSGHAYTDSLFNLTYCFFTDGTGLFQNDTARIHNSNCEKTGSGGMNWPDSTENLWHESCRRQFKYAFTFKKEKEKPDHLGRADIPSLFYHIMRLNKQ